MKKVHDLTKIINGIDLDSIIEDCISAIYANGTSNIGVIEKLSYFKFYQPEFFKKHEQTILMKMGLFYKSVTPQSLEDCVFNIYKEQIKSDFYFLEEWELQLKITSLEVCNPNMLMSHEIQALVQRALAALPVQTREVLLRSRYHSQSNKEIAAALGISVKAVEYHITKALRVLRVVLKDYFPFWLLMCSYWLDEMSCWH